MAAITHRLVTVEEYRKLTENDRGVYHELRHGVIVAVSFPKPRHLLAQLQLRDLLKARAPKGSLVATEFAFRATPDFELRAADVAYVPPERWATQDLDEDFYGVPALVIEVLSPSNTAAEIDDKKLLCLRNGGKEFWVANIKKRQVAVSGVDQRTIVYSSGQKIPLPLFGDGVEIAVDEIFESDSI